MFIMGLTLMTLGVYSEDDIKSAAGFIGGNVWLALAVHAYCMDHL